MEVELKDHNFVNLLKEARCFGKILYVMKPILSKSVHYIHEALRKAFWH